MFIELSELGLFTYKQLPLKVHYKDQAVGEYFAYLIVENKVIVELKEAERIRQEHEFQLINTLKQQTLRLAYF